MQYVEDNTSLSTLEFLAFRPVCSKECSATLSDVMNSPIDVVLKLNEYLDIKDFIEEVIQKEQESKSGDKGRR